MCNDHEPDWRHAETYDYTKTLTRSGWAWEFLRRNPAFREAFSRTSNVLATGEEVSERCDLKRWGVCFCGLDRSQCDNG